MDESKYIRCERDIYYKHYQGAASIDLASYINQY